jgi:hypothetical protein
MHTPSIIHKVVWLIVSPLIIGSLRGQGNLGSSDFVNLDFEQAQVAPGGPANGGFISFATAFPGWSGSVGGNPLTQATYNLISLGGAEVGIMGSAANVSVKGATTPVLDGQFSALLTGGANPPGGLAAASLSQSGLVPAGAESLQMKVGNGWGGSFAVTFGAVPISMIPLSRTVAYTIYGGSIDGFGGLNKLLTITSPGSEPNPNFVLIDDITFSTQFVPESGTLTLIGLGGVFMGFSLRRKGESA